MDVGTTKAVMLDTVIFNRVLDGVLSVTTLGQCRLMATHVQHAELSETPEPGRRDELLKTFEVVSAEVGPVETAVWDVVGWDQAKWSAEDGMFEHLFAAVQEEDRKRGKRKRRINQIRDALIAETAIKNDLLLLTDDVGLLAVMRTFGGDAATLAEFEQELAAELEARRFDQQIERDGANGRLDELADDALREHRNGRTSPL